MAAGIREKSASTAPAWKIYAVATLGVAVVGTFATQPASAAVATGSSASARDLLFKVETPENEGDEGDEGNEGLDGLRGGMFAMMTSNEGGEGDEGEEGNEGDEGDEGDEGGAPVPVDDNNEGDEGDEGNEGDEGDEGGEVIRTTGSTFSQVYCASKATADSFTVSRSAHVVATVEAVADACAPDFDGSTVKIEKLYYDAGLVIADAFADSQAACVSAGNAFGCASASATATAWAQATAEAHATAYAKAIDECVCLKTNAGTLAIGVASTFVELVADAFARAEVTACVSGDAEAYAKAWTACSASAYARVWTQALASAMVSADCFAEASTSIIAATKSEFTVIEGCQQFDESLGDASGSTGGSTAEGVRSPLPS